MRIYAGRKVKRGQEYSGATNAFQANALRMSSTIFNTLLSMDCIAKDHGVIDRNEISIVNVHSC